MKNKKGFVLLETAVVLIVVVIAMLGLYATYSFVFKNLKQSSKYENINDLYKLNVFYGLMENYQFPSGLTIGFVIINSSNCSTYFNDSNCSSIMSDLGFSYFIYTEDNIDDILFSDPTGNGLSNTDINFFKTLETNYHYLIGVRNDSGEYYYISMKAGEIE